MTKSILRIASLLITLLITANTLQAQDTFLGEIKMFAGNFAPRGYALCDGQLLAIAEHTALYSLLGTMYGGDGRTTFALPDLRGRVAIHKGQGPGTSDYRQGDKAGSETVTLTTLNLPTHSHAATVQIGVSDQPGNSSDPTGAKLANTGAFDKEYTDQAATGNLGGASATIGNAGSNQPFSIRQPFNTVNYIIAIEGVWPSRN